MELGTRKVRCMEEEDEYELLWALQVSTRSLTLKASNRETHLPLILCLKLLVWYARPAEQV
jgi:hypothetical protein